MFPKQETCIFGKIAVVVTKFKVEFLNEAAEFLDQIEEKAREKIIYNIRKAQVINDTELFKKLNSEIWEFRTIYKKAKYRFGNNIFNKKLEENESKQENEDLLFGRNYG